MKKTIPTTILAFAVLASPAAAQQMQVQTDADWCRDGWHRDDDRDRDTHCEVRTVTLPATSSFDVNASPNGGIEVEAWDRDEIHVEAKVRTHARRDGEARELAREIEIDVGRGRVDTNGPKRRDRGDGWSVSYRIRVPARTDLDLTSTNGGIAVDGVRGQLELRTTNGGLALRDVAGDVRGRSTNGGITATLTGRRWDGPGLDLQTTNGGIEMEIPAGYSARLEAGSTNGGYDIDFPVTVEGRLNPRRLSADLGEGGPTIRAITTNGGVRIRRG